jgi:CCR4-NOT transcription complex subunit 1
MLAMFAIGVDSKHKFFEKLFDGCVMVLTKAHESSKTRFNQR